MVRLKQITPFVFVTDMGRARRFFEGVLGFSTTFHADNCAFIRRDAVALRLIEVEQGCDLHEPARQQHCYIDVDGIDALYAQMQAQLDKLQSGRVRAPFDT